MLHEVLCPKNMLQTCLLIKSALNYSLWPFCSSESDQENQIKVPVFYKTNSQLCSSDSVYADMSLNLTLTARLNLLN